MTLPGTTGLTLGSSSAGGAEGAGAFLFLAALFFLGKSPRIPLGGPFLTGTSFSSHSSVVAQASSSPTCHSSSPTSSSGAGPGQAGPAVALDIMVVLSGQHTRQTLEYHVFWDFLPRQVQH